MRWHLASRCQDKTLGGSPSLINAILCRPQHIPGGSRVHDFHRGHIALDAHMAAQNFPGFSQALHIIKAESADSGFLQKMPEFSAGTADVQTASCAVAFDKIHIFLLAFGSFGAVGMGGADFRVRFLTARLLFL